MAVATATESVRAAIYTRVSTVDQAASDFSSLDNQRETAERFINGRPGWVPIETRYDDGGFSGGSLDRPALARLLEDVSANRIDAVVVYKLDRISRSILGFAKIIDHLKQHDCAFISVSQQLDTSTPEGKLHLNMLLTFAEYERELISARTRDKVVAARKRGKYTGGPPPLGYDTAPEGAKLLVNRDEAVRVRAIFDVYLKHESLIATLAEMAERRWTTKAWTTRRGYHRKGKSFQKASLRRLLTNPVYIGKVLLQDQTYDGEHEGIVHTETWERAQRILKRNGSNGGRGVRNRYGALLKGILRCAPCDAAMTHSFTQKNGRRYRYYVCVRAQKIPPGTPLDDSPGHSWG
jgi:site-specific DNA recombinase